MTSTKQQRQDDDDVDGFLNHGGSTNFGGLFLQSGGEKGWRKQGKIDVWFYMHTAPKPLWSHQFQEIKARQDKKTKVISKEVWSNTFNCLEDENVLKDRRRDDDDNRLAPFTRCPFCKLIEATRVLVRDGKLDWVEPIFEFVGDDKRKAVTVHAAGIYNGYREVEKGTPEAKALNDAGIYVKEAWKENSNALLKYVFLVVPNDNPKGVMIATEAESLGKAVQKMVRKERMSDDEKGNPWVNPYCIRWIYDDAAVKWDDKYDAAPLRSKELTEGIRKLIDGPRPDISNLLAPGSPATLRARMEAHATKKFRKLVDWDAVFDVPEPEVPAAKTSKPAAAKKTTIPCDDCGAEMDPKATKCPNPKCEAEYEPDEGDDEDDAPDSEETREVKRPVPAAKQGVARKPAPPPRDDEEEDEDEDDDVPFDKAPPVR